jgi:hypothetical protein
MHISGVTGATGSTGTVLTGAQSRCTAAAVPTVAPPEVKMAAPFHDKDMARDFLAGLDPRAHKFTFQFFSDGQGKHAEIFHGTLDEVWPKVQALNTPERGVGVFVTVNETDFKGRRIENIMRPRALFADADSDEQITSCMAAIEASGATPSMIVDSGRGQHFYYVCPDIPIKQFSALQKSLSEKFNTDPAVKDLPRVMRLPGTLHLKNPVKPRLVKLHCMNGTWHFSELVKSLKLSAFNLTPANREHKRFPHRPIETSRAGVKTNMEDIGSAVPVIPRRFAHQPIETLGAGIETNIEDIRSAVSVIPPAAFSKEQDWMTVARGLAHEAAVYPDQAEQLWEIFDTTSRLAPGYNESDNRNRWERYIREAFNHERPITIATVFYLAKQHGWQGWSPPVAMDLTGQQGLPSAEFVDPYADFCGPEFPLDVLPPTLAKFVEAEHRAMGADPSALAMATLTAVAGAIHAETLVCAGESWWERPILWTFLIGRPSAMKSPIIEKARKPLSRIDYERDKCWRREYEKWKQTKGPNNPVPFPPKPPRCIINDVTPEKVAEILSRSPCGSLMVHDELAGWIGSFERYNSGASSRATYLQCWNGGTFLQDRVGKGKGDQDAETRVDNLALCILGGIQPDRLVALGDLTSDGLMQRSLPCLMNAPERGDEYYSVADVESDYDKLINSVIAARPENYYFDGDALEVRDRVNDYLHDLEQVDGFSSALIGAIGKLRGYFARFCLVLEVARAHDPKNLPNWCRPEWARAGAERLRKIFGDPAGSLSDGINPAISRLSAEAAEKIIREFLLPHIFGLYDVVINGGQDRDMLRSIGDFILASPKHRLRPSDFTAGVRALRGQPEQKIREWAGRYSAMGWLEPEEGKPGVPPKAWVVVPGLRERFAERRKQAEAARAEAHAILKAGGSRRSS